MGKWVFSSFFFSFLILVITTEAKAIDYKLPDTEGHTQSLDQYKGKWLVVNYWATWCGTCMEELPELIDFHDRGNRSRLPDEIGSLGESFGGCRQQCEQAENCGATLHVS